MPKALRCFSSASDLAKPGICTLAASALLAGCNSIGTTSQSVTPETCLAGGDEAAINSALKGPGSKAILCRRAIFRLKNEVTLSANAQEIFTAGNAEGDARATLIVSDESLSTAIFSRASDISIHHLIVQGNRAQLGRQVKGGALIEVGGNVSDVQLFNIRASDPRGWSVVHVFEGDRACTGAKILHNEIGPAGQPNGEWADGISFACRNGLIANNVVSDASDGGIVIFGAPGTLVTNNVIRTIHNTLLGGINLVDYKPFDGDYRGVIVRDNKIFSDGGFIKVGIAIGPSVWTDALDQINRGGVVEGNEIRGNNFGYGIAVQGVGDFTVINNKVSGRFTGVRGERCHKETYPTGGALVRNSRMSSGSFDSNFREGILTYSICIEKERN